MGLAPRAEKAARFPSGAYICQSPSDMPVGHFTLAFWLRWGDVAPGGEFTSSATPPRQATVLSYDEDDDSDNSNGLWITNMSALEVWCGGARMQTDINVADGQWHHLALQMRPEGERSNTFELWHNGRLEGRGRLGHGRGWQLRPGRALNLGSRRRSREGFTGQVVLFAVWDRLLQTSELEALALGRHEGARILWPLDRPGALPPKATAHGIEFWRTDVDLPVPGHYRVEVDTSQALDRRARTLGRAPALGAVFTPGRYTIEIEGLGHLDLVITPDGGTLNGQTWHSESTLKITVHESRYFSTRPWQGRAAADGHLKPFVPRTTSRSVLVEDYLADGTRHPVYRSTVRVSRKVRSVELRAEKPVAVTINGKPFTLDPVAPVEVAPNALSLLVITLAATELAVPALHLRTDLMPESERFIVCPDVECHRGMAAWKDGALWAARRELGIQGDEDACHSVQQAATNLARSIQYTHNHSLGRGGHCHDRFVHAARMTHPHWHLDLSKGAGSARHRQLTADEVRRQVAGARRVDAELSQSLLGSIEDLVSQATHIVVHTIDAAVNDVAQTVRHVAADAVAGAEKFGDDIVHGKIGAAFVDVLDAGSRLIVDGYQGGENLGKDLGGGAKELLALTVKVGNQLLQFVLDHSGRIGQALRGLFKLIGATVGKLLRWMMSGLDWEAIGRVQNYLAELVQTSLARKRAELHGLESKARAMVRQLRGQGSDLIGRVDALFGAEAGGLWPADRQAAVPHAAMERLEWLLSHLVHSETQAPADTFLDKGADSGLAQFEHAVAAHLSKDRSIELALQQLSPQLKALIGGGELRPRQALALMSTVVKLLLNGALDLVEALLDLVFAGLEAAFDRFMQGLNEPLDLPFFSAVFRELDDRELTPLNLLTLLVATPATLIAKAAGIELFAGAGKLAQAQAPKTDDLSFAIIGAVSGVVSGALNSLTDLTWVSRERERPLTRQDHYSGKFRIGITGADADTLARLPLIASAVSWVVEAAEYFYVQTADPPAPAVATAKGAKLVVGEIKLVVDIFSCMAAQRVSRRLREVGPFVGCAAGVIELAVCSWVAGAENAAGPEDRPNRTAGHVLPPMAPVLGAFLHEYFVEISRGASVPFVAAADTLLPAAAAGCAIGDLHAPSSSAAT